MSRRPVPGNPFPGYPRAVSAETAAAIDAEASASWGLDPLALVEAAGRNAAKVLADAFPNLFETPPQITLAVGSGNNGADALVLLRALILSGKALSRSSAVVINRPSPPDERSPRSLALRSLQALGVPVFPWGDEAGKEALSYGDLIIDGIAGTGLQGPLRGAAAEMVGYINALTGPARPLVVSLDLPSGNAGFWEEGMPIIRAGAVLALEPLKLDLYKPAARPFAGSILPVGEIFPAPLLERHPGVELIQWERVRQGIDPVSPASYKYERGVVEIRAGSAGSTGAARIAARGAQAAGAGLIRLVADEDIYPILAASAGGIMVVPAGKEGSRFSPDAILLGPGWGLSADRSPALQNALDQEVPLILDADAISLARDRVFQGQAILTPHPGELAAYTGLPKEAALNDPVPLLTRIARERRGTILFKSHVLYIVSEDGRVGVLDGMTPVLSMGGTGDLLAGICAALAARMRKSPAGFDGYTCAAAAAALLIEAARSRGRVFSDPLDLADRAAAIAGAAWL